MGPRLYTDAKNLIGTDRHESRSELSGGTNGDKYGGGRTKVKVSRGNMLQVCYILHENGLT